MAPLQVFQHVAGAFRQRQIPGTKFGVRQHRLWRSGVENLILSPQRFWMLEHVDREIHV